MSTNIDIDQKILREAGQLSGICSEKALVHQALLEFIANRRRLGLGELKGSNLIDEDYDYKTFRSRFQAMRELDAGDSKS